MIVHASLHTEDAAGVDHRPAMMRSSEVSLHVLMNSTNRWLQDLPGEDAAYDINRPTRPGFRPLAPHRLRPFPSELPIHVRQSLGIMPIEENQHQPSVMRPHHRLSRFRYSVPARPSQFNEILSPSPPYDYNTCPFLRPQRQESRQQWFRQQSQSRSMLVRPLIDARYEIAWTFRRSEYVVEYYYECVQGNNALHDEDSVWSLRSVEIEPQTNQHSSPGFHPFDPVGSRHTQFQDQDLICATRDPR